MGWQESCDRTGRLEDAFYSLSKKDQTTILTGLLAVREAAEEALLEYFAQSVDADWFEATSKKKALEELKELANDLRKNK